MKEITLTRGKIALVDDDDFEWLSKFRWRAYRNQCGCWYARRGESSIFMHREILGEPLGVEVDHRDGDGLNNQRYNLRLATHSQNLCNRGKQRNNTSGYKGVSWFKRVGKWHARIQINGRDKHLGYFDILEEAARAYNVAALEHFGEFAKLNEIP